VKATIKPYTAFDAGADAYRRGEWRRRGAVARQVGVIQYIRWWNGLPPTVGVARSWPADRATYYAYGGRWGRTGAFGVFERWPYLPGDIWGFSYSAPVPQSVGQRQVQVGPNHWESRPVYPRRRSY
jgi:hypothetical protein